MSRVTRVTLPRPVEVRHDGRWLAGSLVAARRDRDQGWRGLVHYTVREPAPLAYYHWKDARDLRRPRPFA